MVSGFQVGLVITLYVVKTIGFVSSGRDHVSSDEFYVRDLYLCRSETFSFVGRRACSEKKMALAGFVLLCDVKVNWPKNGHCLMWHLRFKVK